MQDEWLDSALRRRFLRAYGETKAAFRLHGDVRAAAAGLDDPFSLAAMDSAWHAYLQEQSVLRALAAEACRDPAFLALVPAGERPEEALCKLEIS